MKSSAHTIFVMTTTAPHAPTLYWNYVLGYEIRHTDHCCCHDIDSPTLHPPCIMFWNTNIIPMHNMTTGKLGTEILLHQIPSVPPPLRHYRHHPPCIMFWNTNIIPIHNMTTGKFLNRSLTENWPAVAHVPYLIVNKSNFLFTNFTLDWYILFR